MENETIDSITEDTIETDTTLACKVAYVGAPFCGFARQPGQLTVQGEIEHALELLFRREITLTCAGRTDAGVHAKGQVVSFDIVRDELRDRTLTSLERSLNALTHDAISIRELAEMPYGFSARFDAKEREYRYFISTAPTPPLYMRDYCWHLAKPLDLESMRAGARYLIGEHDFKSFCLAVSAVGKPTCRNVSEIEISEVECLGEQLICIKVVGNAFLHSMVRTITGTLVAVGRGQRSPEWVHDVLEARNRSAAGENAPACGLTFWQVRY